MIFEKNIFLRQSGVFLFYGVILAIVGFAELPTVDPGNFNSRNNLFAGKEALFPSPGSEFSIFKPYLPKRGAVSFLMDTPYYPYAPSAEILYAAQSYLVPVVVNKAPAEQRALVYCSKGAIAAGWMQITGYRPKIALADGKYVAEKI